MRMAHNTRRLVNRVRRSVDNVGFVERRSRSRYLTAKRQHRLLATSQRRLEVPPSLRHDGYHLTTLDELGVGNASEVLQGLSALADGLAAKPCPDSDAVFTIWAGDAEILEYPAVFHLGLQPAVLDLVEAYLGFAPAYHGAYVRRDFPRVSTGRSRLWHLDLEDHRMFKLVIYVRDVTEADGPLELVSAPVSRRIVREHGYAGAGSTSLRCSKPSSRLHATRSWARRARWCWWTPHACCTAAAHSSRATSVTRCSTTSPRLGRVGRTTASLRWNPRRSMCFGRTWMNGNGGPSIGASGSDTVLLPPHPRIGCG